MKRNSIHFRSGDRGLRQTESLHPSTRKPGRQGPGEFACGWGDSNPHAVRHQILSLGCLPISTHPHIAVAKKRKKFGGEGIVMKVFAIFASNKNVITPWKAPLFMIGM